MIDWVVVGAAHESLLAAALGRAWRGGNAALAVRGPALIVWAEAASVRRAPRWPDVLTEWAEIYEEPLFASDLGPVLAEELAALGVEALAVHAEPGYARAGTAWYEKGALVRYEHVGSARVAWSDAGGLDRPHDSSAGSMFAGRGRLGRALAEDAGGELIVARALAQAHAADASTLDEGARLLTAGAPAAPDQIAGLVARGPVRRLRLGAA
jgi:hypothetical protein